MKSLLSPLWLSRLLLTILLFGSAEILPWATLEHTTLPDLLLRGVGYGLLVILLLDLAVRYRVRDLFDAMTLIALIGLLASLLITPDVTYADFPRTLATRALGSQTITTAVALGLFLVLIHATPAYRSRALAGLAWIGFYWGTWMRWTPIYGTLFQQPVPLGQMFAIMGIWMGSVLFIYGMLLRSRAPFDPNAFRLLLTPFLLLVAALLSLFGVQASRRLLDATALFITLILIGFSWLVLWFRRSPQHASLLETHFPIQPPPARWFFLAAALFSAMTLLAYYLPLVGDIEHNQLWIMEIGYAAVGLIWLPAMACVIAVHGIDRVMRSRQFEL